MVGKLLAALESQKLEEARWYAEAILHLNEVFKVQSSKHSTKTLVPLSAADLPTLLDTLLETQTLQAASMEPTSRSKLKSLAKNLRDSNISDSTSGQKQEQPASGQTEKMKRLPSKRRYWPEEAKGMFWDLVRALNKYDREFTPQKEKSPIQLQVAETITRRIWEKENEKSG